MEKVRVTQEQAEAIRIAVIDYGSDMVLLDRFRGDGSGVIEGISPVILAKALYIGYEVEPEFKVGDWVSYDNGIPGWVTKEVVRIDGEQLYLTPTGMMLEKYVRHATPEEIAKEKQCRWWKSHNRDVWELRKGDRIKLDNVEYEVTKIWKSSKTYELASISLVPFEVIYVTSGTADWVGLDLINLLGDDAHKVMCFAEDRKDIKS